MTPALIIAPPLFFSIAFVMSMLGLGGAQLFIPILFWLGLDFKAEAIPLGILLNAISSGSAAVTYSLRRMVNWGVAVPFVLAMMIAAPLGAWINLQMADKPLIVLVALFTAISAALLLTRWQPPRRELSLRTRIILGGVAGSALGLLSGLIGRGGGSFVVPLLIFAGLEARQAAATSVLIVTGTSLSSLIAHVVVSAHPDLLLWPACGVAVLAGGLIGSRIMSRRLQSGSIRHLLGYVLIGISLLLIVKDVLLAP